MLKARRPELAFKKEWDGLMNLLILTRRLINKEKDLYLCDPEIVYKRRKFATPLAPDLTVSRPRDRASAVHKAKTNTPEVPQGITLECLEDVFVGLENELKILVYECQPYYAASPTTTPCGPRKRLEKQDGNKVG